MICRAMLRHEDLKIGDIIVSNLNPKVGKVIQLHRENAVELVQIVGVAGNVSDVPLRHIRLASEEEALGYYRRSGTQPGDGR